MNAADEWRVAHRDELLTEADVTALPTGTEVEVVARSLADALLAAGLIQPLPARQEDREEDGPRQRCGGHGCPVCDPVEPKETRDG